MGTLHSKEEDIAVNVSGGLAMPVFRMTLIQISFCNALSVKALPCLSKNDLLFICAIFLARCARNAVPVVRNYMSGCAHVLA